MDYQKKPTVIKSALPLPPHRRSDFFYWIKKLAPHIQDAVEGSTGEGFARLDFSTHAQAFLEINQLRRKLFGLTSDNRVKKAKQGELDILPLGATCEDVAASEDSLKQEVKLVNDKQEAAAEKRKRNPRATSRMVLPDHLEREEVIID